MALKRRHSNNVAIVEEETDDLINCSVCLEVYNDQERKPKFLPCSHTICLRCLQVRNICAFSFLHILQFYY